MNSNGFFMFFFSIDPGSTGIGLKENGDLWFSGPRFLFAG